MRYTTRDWTAKTANNEPMAVLLVIVYCFLLAGERYASSTLAYKSMRKVVL